MFAAFVSFLRVPAKVVKTAVRMHPTKAQGYKDRRAGTKPVGGSEKRYHNGGDVVPTQEGHS